MAFIRDSKGRFLPGSLILTPQDKRVLSALVTLTRTREAVGLAELRKHAAVPKIASVLRRLEQAGLAYMERTFIAGREVSDWAPSAEGVDIAHIVERGATAAKKRRRNPRARRKNSGGGSKLLGIPWWGWLIGVGAGLVYLTMRSATGMISSVAQTAAATPQLPASSDGYGTYGRY